MTMIAARDVSRDLGFIEAAPAPVAKRKAEEVLA
jgi:hypothetical protein